MTQQKQAMKRRRPLSSHDTIGPGALLWFSEFSESSEGFFLEAAGPADQASWPLVSAGPRQKIAARPAA